MSGIQYGTLDLNLLRVFDTLMEERSVSRAAVQLRVTPSAVSHSLNKLRLLIKDDLFLRVAHGMQPTQRALDIAPGIHEALLRVQEALAPGEFQPERSDRHFFISMTPYSSWVMVPPIVQGLSRAAPHAMLGIVSVGANFDKSLDAGQTDLAISMPHYIPERFESELLLRDQLVWAISSRHAPRGPLTLRHLAGMKLVLVGPVQLSEISHDHGADPIMMLGGRRALEHGFAAHDLRQRVGLMVPDAMSALMAVGHSEMAALVPRRLAQCYGGLHGITVFDPPYECPGIEFHLVWRSDRIFDPAVAWLRTLLRSVAAALSENVASGSAQVVVSRRETRVRQGQKQGERNERK